MTKNDIKEYLRENLNIQVYTEHTCKTISPKLVNGFQYPARSELVEVVKEKK